MTRPRLIRAGRTWFVTRRTTRRHFLLRPDRDRTAQNIYLYVTAVIALKFNIRIHAMQVLSTHMHEVLTDMDGNLPAFLRERNRALANALKRHRGWPEEFFQRAPTSCVELYGVNAILHKIAYTLCNCVTAGLVPHPDQWPGVTVRVSDLGATTFDVARPDVYFDPENPVWPASASLKLDMPTELEEHYGERAKRVLTAIVNAAIATARAKVLSARQRFWRRDEIYDAPFSRRATSIEPSGSGDPRFASTGDREQRTRAREDFRVFFSAYRRALDAWRGGIRVRFPLGTWRWCRELGAPMETVPFNPSQSGVPPRPA